MWSLPRTRATDSSQGYLCRHIIGSAAFPLPDNRNRSKMRPARPGPCIRCWVRCRPAGVRSGSECSPRALRRYPLLVVADGEAVDYRFEEANGAFEALTGMDALFGSGPRGG